MEQTQKNQIQDLYSACEQINNIFCSVYNIAIKANAPEQIKQDFSDVVSELHNNIFRIINYIAMPNAENIDPVYESILDNYLEVVADTVTKDIPCRLVQ